MKRVKPSWLTEMSAKWREPAPPMGPGEAKLFAFVRDEDVQAVVPPAAPHVDRALQDLTRAGWGSPARSLAVGLLRAGFGPLERARGLVDERVRDGRLVLAKGGRWRWWSDIERRA